MNRIKQIIITGALALSAPLMAQAQSSDPLVRQMMRAQELSSEGSHIGTLKVLTPRHIDRWSLPFQDEEAQYLDAIARGALSTSDGESHLLSYIEQHPHSAYLPYAQMRLGEWYYLRGQYASAAYWFKQYSPGLLPEDLAASSDYYLAYSLMREGSVGEALNRFKPLRYAPSYRRDASFYIGYLLCQQGRGLEAQDYLTPLLGDEEYGPHATAYIADALLSAGQHAKALAIADRSVALTTPAEVRSSLLRSAGLSAAAVGEKEIAIARLQDYARLEGHPGRLELLVLGRTLLEENRNAEALTYLSRLNTPEAPTDFISQLGLYSQGIALLSLRRVAEAQVAFEQAEANGTYAPLTDASAYNAALSLYSNNPGYVGDGTFRLENYLNRYPKGAYVDRACGHLTDTYLHDPNVDKAMASLERIFPLPEQLARVKERVRLRKGNLLLDQGDTTTAASQYDEIIRNSTDSTAIAEAYFWKGEVAYRNGQYGDALNATQQYLKVRPASLPLNPNAYYNLGYAYFSLSRPLEAARSFREYLKVRPNPTADEATTIYSRLADIEVQSKQYSEALALYDRALAQGGAEADYAYFKRGMVLGYLKQYKEKAHHLALMSSRYPSSAYGPEAMFEQGRALTLIGDESGAQNVYRRVFESYPHDKIAPKAGVQLALSYFNMHQLTEAAQIYEQVVRRYPETDEAKSALLDLKSISVDLNRVDEYSALAAQTGLSQGISIAERDSLSYLAAERVAVEGEREEGHRALEKYLATYPEGAFATKALYQKALLYYNSKDYHRATETLEMLRHDVRLDSRIEGDALRLLATSYEAIEEWGKAAELYLSLARRSSDPDEVNRLVIKSCETAVRSESHDFVQALAQEVESGKLSVSSPVKVQVYGDALAAYIHTHRKTEARHYSQLLLEMPDNGMHARAHVVSALLLYDQGKTAEARRTVQRVVDRGTTDTYWLARAFILLSDIYASQGDKATAKVYLDEIRSNYPHKHDGILELVKEKSSRL